MGQVKDSYKLKTYPTLYKWKPLHKKIIDKYKSYPNKADFLRTALEFFAQNGFPGIEVEPQQQMQQNSHQETIHSSDIAEDEMSQKEMEIALGDL